MYAILDIEGTGGKYNEEGITEIAIYQFDGHEVTDKFSSLVNPERRIDPYVTKLTGINNKMLAKAPKFYELAKRIIEITEDCVIVAHNTDFDLRILQLEFDRLGYEYNRTTLCTVELSQKLLPDQESYSLGKLVRSLGIPITDRHRATGDATATLRLFQLLLNKDTDQSIIQETLKKKVRKRLPKNLKELLDTVPSVTGTYSFYDMEQELIFLGKGKNVKSQVNRHFTKPTRLNKLLVKNVVDITTENTGNNLIAAIKENETIKKLQPKFNKKRRKIFSHELVLDEGDDGYIYCKIQKHTGRSSYFLTFSNRQSGMNFLERIFSRDNLDLHFSNHDDYNNSHAPKNYMSADKHNELVMNLMSEVSLKNKTGIIKTRGREPAERAILWVDKGHVKGYGYSTLKIQSTDPNILEKIVTDLNHPQDARHISEQFLRTHRGYKVEELN
ncbi:hypothetical protein BST97_04515 [Nonlabens spongiae]|uniref:GIY-YIG domain-containing protein n=1 Tax=Nonlabens spongiae TaxID=331648 RepID=A0A1W6MI84_9FLAO|nr:exonuclease domain-containing protein [Nonlabens spongiae]ARN77303.1 hypothetical protein BST97_04515 [Nonlabens spongiae]